MLYDAILRLEVAWPGFNKVFFKADDVLSLAARQGIIAVPETLITTARILRYRSETVIVYNPHIPEPFLTLLLGHELGHYALGHLDVPRSGSLQDLFSRSGMEKDASIIGYLFMMPTPFLKRLEESGQMSAYDLFYTMNFCCDIHENDLWALCEARLRIYRAFKRLENYVRGGSRWSGNSG